MFIFSFPTFSFIIARNRSTFPLRIGTPSQYSTFYRAVNSTTTEMADVLNTAQQLGTEKYPRKSDKWIQYGTAGFRTKYCYFFMTIIFWNFWIVKLHMCFHSIWNMFTDSFLVSFLGQKNWHMSCIGWEFYLLYDQCKRKV